MKLKSKIALGVFAFCSMSICSIGLINYKISEKIDTSIFQLQKSINNNKVSLEILKNKNGFLWASKEITLGVKVKDKDFISINEELNFIIHSSILNLDPEFQILLPEQTKIFKLLTQNDIKKINVKTSDNLRKFELGFSTETDEVKTIKPLGEILTIEPNGIQGLITYSRDSELNFNKIPITIGSQNVKIKTSLFPTLDTSLKNASVTLPLATVLKGDYKEIPLFSYLKIEEVNARVSSIPYKFSDISFKRELTNNGKLEHNYLNIGIGPKSQAGRIMLQGKNQPFVENNTLTFTGNFNFRLQGPIFLSNSNAYLNQLEQQGYLKRDEFSLFTNIRIDKNKVYLNDKLFHTLSTQNFFMPQNYNNQTNIPSVVAPQISIKGGK